MRGRPSGANMRAISSSEKPAAEPSAISASRSSTRGIEQAAQAAPAAGRDQPLFLVEPQRGGRNAGALRATSAMSNVTP